MRQVISLYCQYRSSGTGRYSALRTARVVARLQRQHPGAKIVRLR